LAGLRSSSDRNFEGRPLGRKDCQPLTFLHAISPALEQFTQHGAHVTRPIDNSQALSAGRRIVQLLAKPRYKSSVASVNYTSLTIHNIEALRGMRTKTDYPDDEDLRRYIL